MTPITEPGVYDMTADEYHADPVPGGSLSSSGARKLLPPSCPALFRYDLDHGEKHRRTFDFGHAAHGLVLGSGPELVVVDAPDWRTKAARQQRDEAYENGAVPLLADEYVQVVEMAAALREHPIASVLLDPDGGRPEQSLFWVDGPTGVKRRARLDWLPEQGDGRMIVADYKTTKSAAPDDIERAISSYGYHQQAAWYLDGLVTLDLADVTAAFVFIFQEKEPPYLVTVAEPDLMALRIGDALNRRAIDIYAKCRADDAWPGYSDDVERVRLPYYIERAMIEEFAL